VLAFGRLSRTAKILVVLLVLALAPVRAFAIATVGFCAMNDAGATAVHAGHGESHEHDKTPPSGNLGEHCDSCVEHCLSAALVPVPEPLLAAAPGDRRIGFAERIAATFFPDPLDPPPLAG